MMKRFLVVLLVLPCLLLAGCHQRTIPIITCGGAGGMRDPSRIRLDDLSRSFNDPLLNQVRKNLRSNYGFPAGNDPKKKIKARKFGIDCVFSPETAVFPQCDGTVSEMRPEGTSGNDARLNCASGFGSITHMTATFGFFAVYRCLERLS